MARASPLPSSRENLIDLRGQVDAALERHVKLGRILEEAHRGQASPLAKIPTLAKALAISQARAFLREGLAVEASRYTFAEYVDWSDVDLEALDPMAMHEAILHLLMDLHRAIREKLDQVEGRTADDPADDAPDLVTLNQAASMVHRTKRTLERYKTRGALPRPLVDGGGGKPDLYDWKVIGPWLESTFGVKQPARFPASRRRLTDT